MTTTILARPRLTAKPAGTSGRKALAGISLCQDKALRRQLAEADKAAYLQAGGHQNATILTADEQLQEEIRQLFLSGDWDTFSGL